MLYVIAINNPFRPVQSKSKFKLIQIVGVSGCCELEKNSGLEDRSKHNQIRSYI